MIKRQPCGFRRKISMQPGVDGWGWLDRWIADDPDDADGELRKWLRRNARWSGNSQIVRIRPDTGF
jgi:hypothetical protein